MEITLRINGEDKTFVKEFVPLKFYRKALELEKYAQSKNVDEEKLFDKRLNLIVEVFDHQFTKDELENGLNAINHQKVFYDIIGVGILGYPPIDENDMGKILKEVVEKELQSENK
jgi:hypothetical protein